MTMINSKGFGGVRRLLCSDKWTILATCLVVLGCLVVLIAAIILGGISAVYRSEVQKQTRLSKDSLALAYYENPPYDGTLEVWFSNLTNPHEFVAGTAKPALREIGPYVYSSRRRKSVEVFDNGTLLVTPRATYYFDHSASGYLSQDDNITLLNIPLLAAHKTVRSTPLHSDLVSLINGGINLAEGNRIFLTKPVRELMFDGYNDAILAIGAASGKNPDKMGFYYNKNNTDDLTYEIDSDGNMLKYNGQSSLRIWLTPEANKIRGTDGSLFHPFVDKTDTLELFSSDMCRSIRLKYDSSDTLFGVPVDRFVLPDDVFNTTLEENYGFCQPTTVKFFEEMPKLLEQRDAYCLPAGLLNISSCKQGAPIILSLPHFSLASAELLDSVDGLVPDSQKYQSAVLIEPNSGVGLQFSMKMQINVAVEPQEPFRIFNIKLPAASENLRPTILPTLWINETVTANPDFAEQLYGQIYGKKPKIQNGMIAMIVLGIALALIGTVAVIVSHVRKSANSTQTRAAASKAGLPAGQTNPGFELEVSNPKLKQPLH